MQIKFLGFLEKAKMKAVRQFAGSEKEKRTGGEAAAPLGSFFDVIEGAQGASVEKENIWTDGGAEASREIPSSTY